MPDSLTFEELEDPEKLEQALEDTDVPMAGDPDPDEGEHRKVEEPEQEESTKTEDKPGKTDEPEDKIDYAKEKVVPVDVHVKERKKFQTQLEEQQRQIDELKAGAQPEPEPEPEPEPAISAYSDDEIEELKDEFGDDYAERAVKERKILLDQQQEIADLKSNQSELMAEKQTKDLLETLDATPLLKDWYENRDGEKSKEFEAAIRFAKAAVAAFPDKSEVEQNKWVVEQVKSEFGIKDADAGKQVRKVSEDPMDGIDNIPGGTAVSKKSTELELITAVKTGQKSIADLTDAQRDQLEDVLDTEADWGTS